MQKFTVQNNRFNMYKIFFINTLLFIGTMCNAQSDEFIRFSNLFKTKIDLPSDSIEVLAYIDSVDTRLMNEVLFNQQETRAKFYSIKNELFRVTTYGKISEKTLEYEDWKRDGDKITWFNRTFTPKAYSLGKMELDDQFSTVIIKVVGFEKTYIDLYVFNSAGKLMSLVNLYEVDYVKNGEPAQIANTYIQSSITEEGIIRWEENRFNVKTKREYGLQPDGYFKILSQTSEGDFEL